MSFRVDLWNGLNVIKTQFNLTFNKISALNEFLLSYCHCQKAHFKNLENLYKENKDKDIFKSDYLLDKSISELINNFKTEYELYREHYKYIKENILTSLREIAEKEKATFNNIYNEGIKLEEDFTKIKNNLFNKQNEYNNTIKDFYNFISDYDDDDDIMTILKGINNNEKDNDTKLEKAHTHFTHHAHTKSSGALMSSIMIDINKMNNTQNIKKRDKLIAKINEKKNDYSLLLDESNKYINTYRNKMENILQSLEENYQCLIIIIQSTLFSTNEQRIHLINNLTLLTNTYLNDYLNKVNKKKEVFEFIIKNATKEFPINKFEFITYQINDSKIKCIDINKYLKEKIENNVNLEQEPRRGNSGKKSEVRKFRRKTIIKKNTGDHKENQKILENSIIYNDIKIYKIKTNILLIEDFVNEIIMDKGKTENSLDAIYYNDSSSKMIDISKIKTLLDKDNTDHLVYLESIIKSLNCNRAKGNFVITKKSYDAFIELFTFMLDNYSTNDFILKNIIILAQTFYKLPNNKVNKKNISNDEKIFIQNGLKNKQIFNNSETWHRVINFTLATNIINKEPSAAKNELIKKKNIIMYNTLVAYLCDLKYFTDDENAYNEVKTFYSRAYQLDEEAIAQQIDNIINYEPIKESKKIVSFSIQKK